MNSPQPINLEKGQAAFNENGPLLEFLERLSSYLDADGVTEVCINRPGEVEVESSKGWHAYDDPDIDLNFCERLSKLIASYTGQRIGPEDPILFGSMPMGERVQVVVPPATLKGTISITFRKPSGFRRTLDEYEESGTFSNVDLASLNQGTLSPTEEELFGLYSDGDIANFLRRAIATHQNIVVSGATGAGKTSLMRSLISLIPTHERLITLENTDEIKIWETHRNSVALFYSANLQGKNKITQRELLRSCLRMNPRRILLAELTEGEEAMSFINSINCGHPGSITSIHANSSMAAFERLISMVGDSASGQGKPDHVLRRLLSLTVDIVVQCTKIEIPGKPSTYPVSDIYYDPKKKYEIMSGS